MYKYKVGIYNIYINMQYKYIYTIWYKFIYTFI